MTRRHALLIAGTFLTGMIAVSHASVQLFGDDFELPFSSGCNTALLASLPGCNYLEPRDTMYTLTANLTKETLDGMCTAECKSSIETYRQAVESACANDELDSSNSSTTSSGGSTIMRPIALPDMVFANYYHRCLKNSEGEYCFLAIKAAGGQQDCDECNLEIMRQDLSNGYFYNEGLAEEFRSLTFSCSATMYDFEEPTQVILASPTAPPATPTTTCPGKMIDIQPGDTCDTYAKRNNVGTWRLLIDNKLQSGCANFPETGSLWLARKYGITTTQFITWNQVLNSICSNFDIIVGHEACVSYPGEEVSYKNPYATGAVGGTATAAAPDPTNLAPEVNTKCGKYYTVKSGDYCQAIAMANGIQMKDLYFLNPDIDTNCTNLWLDYNYCVLPVGNIETYAGYGGTSDTTSATNWVPTVTAPLTDLTILSTSLTPWKPIVTATTAPMAERTRKGCVEYRDNTMGDVPCDWLAPGVSVVHFAEWNPSVDYWNCTLTNNTRYCTLYAEEFLIYNDPDLEDGGSNFENVPGNAAFNSTEECFEWYSTVDGDTCDSILEGAAIEFIDFYDWNPSIGPDCTNLWLNTSYCVMGAWINAEEEGSLSAHLCYLPQQPRRLPRVPPPRPRLDRPQDPLNLRSPPIVINGRFTSQAFTVTT
ncbi:hypothetical protein BDV18DRAFT_155199 [Aspergillus unguis]